MEFHPQDDNNNDPSPALYNPGHNVDQGGNNYNPEGYQQPAENIFHFEGVPQEVASPAREPAKANDLEAASEGNIPQQLPYGAQWGHNNQGDMVLTAGIIQPQMVRGIPVNGYPIGGDPLDSQQSLIERQYQAMTWCPRLMCLLFAALATFALILIPVNYQSEDSDQCSLYLSEQILEGIGLFLFALDAGFLYRAMVHKERHRFQTIMRGFAGLSVIVLAFNLVYSWGMVQCDNETLVMSIIYFIISALSQLIILFYFYYIAKKVYEYIIIRMTSSSELLQEQQARNGNGNVSGGQAIGTNQNAEVSEQRMGLPVPVNQM